MHDVPVGLIHAPVTPLASDGTIDMRALESVIAFHTAQAPDALCVPLHIGESPNLSLTERKLVLAATMSVVDGRLPVLAHVSAMATKDAAELAMAAEAVGVSGIVAAPPYYWNLGAMALRAHFEVVANCVGMPLILYLTPTRRGGSTMSADEVVALAGHLHNLAGLKDGRNDWEAFASLSYARNALDKPFALFTGVEYVLPALGLGGSGCFSVLGAIAPKLVNRLFRTVQELGHCEEALRDQLAIARLWDLLRPSYPARIKAAMQIMGRPVGSCRLPIPALTLDEMRTLERELARDGRLADEPHGW